MKDSAYKISLDINEHSSQAVLNAKQSDTGRKVHISLRAGGTPYTIEDNCYAVFEAKKPDGSIMYNACTIEGNEIIYEFTEQTCSVVGITRCEIKLYGLGEKLITSPRFALIVEGTIYPDARVASADEFTALTKMVFDTFEAKENADKATANANTAADIANQATLNANTAADSANEASTVAYDAMEKASIATRNAERATENAGLATTNAIGATSSANQASERANQAAQNANTATDNANLATKNANDAAFKAAHTAKSLMVVGEAKGTAIPLDDAIDQYLVGLRVFGKTTQDGTPTPDAPVEFVSVGDCGSITVNVTGDNDAQNMTVATPNGLPGVPVTSGGNYTDANGQQWICDEIDFASGVYVQRIGFTNLTDVQWVKNDIGKYFTTKNNDLYSNAHRVVCTHIKGGIPSDSNKENVIFINANNDIRLNITLDDDKVEAVQETMNGATLIGALVSPIYTPLSEEELAAYASLHTYKDNTTVFNDAGAWMDLEYVMDAKKYIDGLMAGGLAPATVE